MANFKIEVRESASGKSFVVAMVINDGQSWLLIPDDRTDFSPYLTKEEAEELATNMCQEPGLTWEHIKGKENSQ